jgi:hypothetical protein
MFWIISYSGYGLDDRGCMVRFSSGAGNFSLHHRVQNGSEAYLVSYPMGTGDFFPGVKRPGRVADHSIHLMPRSRMRGAIPPLPQCYFVVWCLVKHREKFNFYLYLYHMTLSTRSGCKISNHCCEIRGFHGGEDSSRSLLCCDAASY